MFSRSSIGELEQCQSGHLLLTGRLWSHTDQDFFLLVLLVLLVLNLLLLLNLSTSFIFRLPSTSLPLHRR